VESLRLERASIRTGFTLVEVLIVLAILALSAAVLVPNFFPDQQRALAREAARLADSLQHAALAAQWRGETLAWSADGASYRFWRIDTSAGDPAQPGDSAHAGWRAMEDDEVLSSHALPDGERVQLLRLRTQPATESWLIFRADGLNEPYTLALENSAARILLSADPLNRVTFADAQR
jgi:general secretion pathway protein H